MISVYSILMFTGVPARSEHAEVKPFEVDSNRLFKSSQWWFISVSCLELWLQ